MSNRNETTRKILYVLLTVVMVAALAVAGVIVGIDLVDMWRAGSVNDEVKQLYRPGASSFWLRAWIGTASAEEEPPRRRMAGGTQCSHRWSFQTCRRTLRGSTRKTRMLSDG